MLSHNLYTVLHIPHDPVALEEHFRDDDDGPVSSQGYMPYLNKYILDKVGPSKLSALPASQPGQHTNTPPPQLLPLQTPIFVPSAHPCGPTPFLHVPATCPS